MRSLDEKNGLFQPQGHDEELFGLEVLYLSAIGVLMYLDSHL